MAAYIKLGPRSCTQGRQLLLGWSNFKRMSLAVRYLCRTYPARQRLQTLVPRQQPVVYIPNKHIDVSSGQHLQRQLLNRKVTWCSGPRRLYEFRCQQTCYFHTTSPKHINPMIWMVLKPIAKLSAILTGRQARQKLKTLSKEKQREIKRYAMLAGLVLFSLPWIYYYSHQQEVRITGRKRFISLTPDQYMKVSQFETEQFLTMYKDKMLLHSHPYYKQILRVAQRLVNANIHMPEMKCHQWTICVVDSPEQNAFVLPTGHVFVFTGLIEFVSNDDQLAAVIGHEMAHALLSHAAEKISFSQFMDYFVIAIMAAIWTIMPNDGIAIITQWFYNKVMDLSIHLPYSRTLEKEADIVGLELTARACFDVREGSVFWRKMELASNQSAEGPDIPQWLSTHPSHEKRVELFDHLIPQAVDLRESCQCPTLPKIDPRIQMVKLRKAEAAKTVAIAARQNLSKVTLAKEDKVQGKSGILAQEDKVQVKSGILAQEDKVQGKSGILAQSS